jgi:nucleoside-triphosphatase
MKILLTGPPRIGKTTLILRTAELLTKPYAGFYTEEILEEGKRVGFSLQTFSGKTGILSHIDFKSRFRVGKYRVSLTDLEEIALPEIEEGIKQKQIILIDEIGKMELYSAKFTQVVLQTLNSNLPFVGTIVHTAHPWADEIKKRKDVELIEVTPENRDRLVQELTQKLASST